MVAAYVSASHQTYVDGSSTTAVLPSPTGAAAGDLAIVILHLESGIQTITKPSGWTEEAQHNSGTTLSIYLLWKYLTGSEVAADRTFSWAAGCWRSADMVLIRGGVTSGNPFGGAIGEATGASGTSRTSISYTTSGAGLGFWVHSEWADGGTVTLPSGYTSRATSADHGFRFADRSDTSGSKTTGTGTGGNAAWVAFAQTILDTAGGTDGTVAAVTATATAAGVAPTLSASSTVSAAVATATASTPAAVVSGGAEVVAVVATATSEALAPALLAEGNVTSVPATATGEALPPTVSGGASLDGSVTAVTATATATALTPTATGGAETASVAATSTSLALPPTVSAGATVTGVAATASAVGVAPTATGTADVVAAVATATAQAHAPVVTVPTDVNVAAAVAMATALAEAPEVSTETVLEGTGEAVATAMAHPPVVTATAIVSVSVPVIFMQAYCHPPVVSASAGTYRFECPTHEETIQSAVAPLNRHTLTHAKTIYRTEDGTFAARRMPPPRLITGVEGIDYFLGGRVYEVPSAVAMELQAAGYTPVPI